jgi:hypothetical protein
VRARDRGRGARRGRGIPSRVRRHASAGTSSVEYGLLIALIGAMLCLGIGYSVKAMFLPAINCFFSNLQGVTDPGCASSPGPPPGGGGGPISPGPAITPGPSATPTPSPTPTPTASPTP